MRILSQSDLSDLTGSSPVLDQPRSPEVAILGAGLATVCLMGAFSSQEAVLLLVSTRNGNLLPNPIF